MDNFRILKNLEKLAEKAIDVLNQSRGARSRSEASLLRKSLQITLAWKEEKLEDTLMNELIAVLRETAKFLIDPNRSFKSEKFKNLGNEIFSFLEKIGIENTNENMTKK